MPFAAAVVAAHMFIILPIQVFDVHLSLWLTSTIAFGGIPYALLAASGVQPARWSGLDSCTSRSLALGAGLGVANYFAFIIPSMVLVMKLAPADWLEDYKPEKIFDHANPVTLAFIVIAVGFASPIAEEFFFRGILQRGLERWLSPSMALWGTAIIFSGIHGDMLGFIPRLELALLLGLIARYAGSIWPAVAAHAASNLTAYVLSTTVTLETGETSLLSLLVCLLAGGALLALLVIRWWPALRVPRPWSLERRDPPQLIVAFAPWAIAASLGFIFAALAALQQRSS